jgi:osmotically-inducible protein OsmY
MITRLLAAFLTLIALTGIVIAETQPITDNAINDNVRLRLSSDAQVKGGALQVAVANGVVTLGGVLETEKLKERATKLTKKVKGVKQVVNNIVVKKPAAK